MGKTILHIQKGKFNNGIYGKYDKFERWCNRKNYELAYFKKRKIKLKLKIIKKDTDLG